MPKSAIPDFGPAVFRSSALFDAEIGNTRFRACGVPQFGTI